MDAEVITISTAAEWQDFWANNRETLVDEVGDEDACLSLAKRNELVIGGGAAALFQVDARALVEA